MYKKNTYLCLVIHSTFPICLRVCVRDRVCERVCLQFDMLVYAIGFYILKWILH